LLMHLKEPLGKLKRLCMNGQVTGQNTGQVTTVAIDNTSLLPVV
jgi:hypothetical protein